MLKVRVKKLCPEARIPKLEHSGDSGVDLYSVESCTIMPGEIRLVKTGLAISFPEGFEAQVRPKSGLALNSGIGIVNSPGTIDSGYRGEICVILVNHGKKDFVVEKGKKICQMVFQKIEKPEFEISESLDETKRGKNGFGSTGLD
ncbi:MAG: dUTP diphosphatase [Candidatus ainarchaeum sp.]|nr:dUTP diphosphatase [Candidatus ainarchaeum sp.]